GPLRPDLRFRGVFGAGADGALGASNHAVSPAQMLIDPSSGNADGSMGLLRYNVPISALRAVCVAAGGSEPLSGDARSVAETGGWGWSVIRTCRWFAGVDLTGRAVRWSDHRPAGLVGKSSRSDHPFALPPHRRPPGRSGGEGRAWRSFEVSHLPGTSHPRNVSERGSCP